MSISSQTSVRVNLEPSLSGPGSVSVCCLGPDVLAFLRDSEQSAEVLKSIFRVSVARTSSPEDTDFPDVSGRYHLFEDEVRFVPHFPFERGVKYRVSFGTHLSGVLPGADSLYREFVIPAELRDFALTEVTRVFPSSDFLPENLLRFYVCFSNSMQRGKALEEISILDSEGRPVADALYRPPLELWDKSMRRLTVLLDPGRLKRWVGPNLELGPPLKAGHEYTLEVGSGMTDMIGRRLSGSFRKHFIVCDPIRDRISLSSWNVVRPVTGTRDALVIMFPSPLDWALLFHTITIESANGTVIDGRIVVDECERQWRFIPMSLWSAGIYQIRVGSGLEDVCGNSPTGAFDRALQSDRELDGAKDRCCLVFKLS
jgi:hypothetical protein